MRLLLLLPFIFWTMVPLKLMGVITFSWLWVTLPAWGPCAVITVAYLDMLFVSWLETLIERCKTHP